MKYSLGKFPKKHYTTCHKDHQVAMHLRSAWCSNEEYLIYQMWHFTSCYSHCPTLLVYGAAVFWFSMVYFGVRNAHSSRDSICCSDVIVWLCFSAKAAWDKTQNILQKLLASSVLTALFTVHNFLGIILIYHQVLWARILKQLDSCNNNCYKLA